MKQMALFVSACALVLMCGGPALAAGELCLSTTSGGTCSSPLVKPLFDPSLRWIPGDREEGSFYARNQSADEATMDVTVIGSEADADKLLKTGELRVEVRAGDGPWQRTNLTGRQQLVSSMPVAPGQELKVSVAAIFPYGSVAQNQSQVRHLDLQFEVRLAQDASTVGNGNDQDDSDDNDDSDDSEDGDSSGILPGTGGPVWWLLPAGLLGVASGWLTVAVSRRSEGRADV